MLALRRLIVVICFLAFNAALPIQAQEGEDVLFLTEELSLAFAPEDVFFLIEGSAGSVQRLRALTIPIDPLTGKYMVGVKLHAASELGNLSYSVLVLGKANQFESLAAKQRDSSENVAIFQSTDTLQEELASRRTVLASYRLQVQSQEESLRRLRQDAELIGNFGRVMETSDEIERMRTDISNADKSAQAMENLIRVAAALPAPKNAMARETQLTMQLGELAQAAKNAEASELSRKVGMEADLRERLAIVESSRFDDYDSLQQELNNLRGQRLALEKQKGITSPPANSTPVAVSPDVEY